MLLPVLHNGTGFYKLKWHFNERLIGILMAINGIIIALFEMVMIHMLERRRNGLIYISIGVLLGGIGFALLDYLPGETIPALIVVLLMTFSEMLSAPFMNTFWLTRTTEFNRGEYAALYSMAWSAAQVLAPFTGSIIISFGDFFLLWWVLAILSVFAAAGYYLLYRVTTSPSKAVVSV